MIASDNDRLCVISLCERTINALFWLIVPYINKAFTINNIANGISEYKNKFIYKKTQVYLIYLSKFSKFKIELYLQLTMLNTKHHHYNWF